MMTMAAKAKRDAKRAETIRVWGEGKRQLWRPGDAGPVDIPDHYVEVKPGDAYTTHQIKLRCEVVYARMKKDRRFSRCVGLLAPRDVVKEAQKLAKKTESARAEARDIAKKKREAAQAERAAAIADRFPRLPAPDLVAIARRATAADVDSHKRIERLVQERALASVDHTALAAKHGKAKAKAAAKKAAAVLVSQWRRR